MSEFEDVVGQEPYVSITNGMRGWFAVLLIWVDDMGCHTPWNTGVLSFETADFAIRDAKIWAESEAIVFCYGSEIIDYRALADRDCGGLEDCDTNLGKEDISEVESGLGSDLVEFDDDIPF